MTDEFDIQTKRLANLKSLMYRGDRLEKVPALTSVLTVSIHSASNQRRARMSTTAPTTRADIIWVAHVFEYHV